MKRLPQLVQNKIASLLKEHGELKKISVPSLPGASSALTALALHRIFPKQNLFIIAPTIEECEAVFSDLNTFKVGEEPLLILPPEKGDHKSLDQEGIRLAAAKRLYSKSEKTAIFITTPSALLFPIPNPCQEALSGITLKKGFGEIPFSNYKEKLTFLGYERAPEVITKGTFAVRGGILDIWPVTSPLPLRADFFGDEVDSLRTFDPMTQRSMAPEEEAWIPPCSLDKLPSKEAAKIIKEDAILLWLEYGEAPLHTRLPDDDAPSQEAFNSLCKLLGKNHAEIFSDDITQPDVARLNLDFVPPPTISDSMGLAADPTLRSDARKNLISDLERRADTGEQIFIAIDTPGGVEWISRALPKNCNITLTQAILSGGFSSPSLGISVLAQPDIYSTRKKTARRLVPSSIATKGERVRRTEDLHPGDLVVHLDHGVGRFEGISKITVAGKTQEVLTIEYRDGIKLHVPVSQTHLLSRYIGVRGKQATLNRLGSKKWRQDCIKAEHAVIDYASMLLDLQARRDAKPGFAFDPEPPWLDSFEASFPYKETKDQINCISAVKKDMASRRPMDRLICGDAGYGKTEVAMRAAFLAVMNGKQVAILAPTTILAEQHYASFKERMALFPVHIEVISRLHTPKERADILDMASKGTVDILIGTHAIVQPGIKFNDLGLVIIDEEQRFGVDHKERLKRIKTTVDVLTLSATPIPRTLYMSMTGARDMSLLQTPPQERLEIETKVLCDSDEVIRKAVMKEINREGQVFFLHNRVLTIKIMLNRLRRILPEVRIAVAHGQMAPAELAETMKAFEAGEYDLLLSTSIIESGLDIPRANTIIIHRADRFGLAELYQLRGRVGRSSRRGYAYLIVPEQGIIDSDARERIKAIQRHGGLSGGLNLALRDLEIRGAGNMLGAEQSGHIAAVGFGLYCQLLKRAVSKLRGESQIQMVETTLDLDFVDISPGFGQNDPNAACIPFNYIEDESIRMQIHKKMAEATTAKEIDELKDELKERFGPLPQEARRLLRLARLRILASIRSISKIEVRDGVIRPYDRQNRPIPTSTGLFPRTSGKTVDDKIASLFRAIGE